MAGTIIETPDISAEDWTDFIIQVEKMRKGFMALTFTNFDNTDEPAVASGSIIEMTGAIYQFTETAIDWSAAGSVASAVWITVVRDAAISTCSIVASDDAPIWVDAKQGYYGSAGSLTRYAGGCYIGTAGVYYHKKILELTPSNDAGRIEAHVVKNRTGWLWCDGSEIDSSANPEYINLIGLLNQEVAGDTDHPYYAAGATIATLPDLRGVVIRGIDAASNRDKDDVRKSGGYQADDNKTHTHNLKVYNANTGNFTLTLDMNDGSRNDVSNGALASGAEEATMKNIALYYLIKY